MSKARGVTLEEVARVAKVSRATVSRIVNGVPTVDPRLAVRVHEAIDRLGYVPNWSARSLASKRSGAIALLVPEDLAQFFGDPFFAAMVAGMDARLQGSEHFLNLLVASQKRERTTQYLLGGEVDAAVAFSHSVGDGLIERVASVLPVVLAGRPPNGFEDRFVHVDFDNVGGARRATRYLLDRRQGPVATICGPQDTPTGVDRLAGFHEAHAETGRVPGPVVAGDFSTSGGARAARQILDSFPEPPSAVFAANDLMAFGVLGVLHARGMRVPQDVAVIGFDDAPGSDSTFPPLTTARQDSMRQGEVIADTLLSMLAGQRGRTRTVLPVELVHRESA